MHKDASINTSSTSTVSTPPVYTNTPHTLDVHNNEYLYILGAYTPLVSVLSVHSTGCRPHLPHFSPEMLLQSLLDLLEYLLVLEDVTMCEDTRHFGEVMGLEDIQELKCFHFKSKTDIN